MQILPKIRTRFGEGIGVELFISHPDLNENEQSFLTTNYNAGVSSLVVDNANEFTTNEYVVVNSLGSDKAEILSLSTVSGSTQTLTVSSTIHAHNRGEQVTFIPYNQIIIQRSTDGTTYSDLSTISIRVDSTETFYVHLTGASTDYYRAKFYNSTSTNESQVSDGIIATGYVDNSAGQIIRAALLSLGEKIDGEVLTKEFLFQALHEGREELDSHPNVERWAFRTVFDYDFGDMIPGRFTIALPTDLREPDTYKNILSLRLGRENSDVIPTDKNAINKSYQNIAHSTLDGAITTGSTSIVLTSSGDFNESGSVDIAAESISAEIDNVDYTTNTESTRTLGTVTNIGANHADDRDVWQGASFGIPTHYTVDNGVITFSQPFDNDNAGENIKGDYYAKLTRADSDGDVLDEDFASTLYIPYIRWRIRKRKDATLIRNADPDYIEFREKLEAQVLKQFSGQDMRLSYQFEI